MQRKGWGGTSAAGQRQDGTSGNGSSATPAWLLTRVQDKPPSTVISIMQTTCPPRASPYPKPSSSIEREGTTTSLCSFLSSKLLKQFLQLRLTSLFGVVTLHSVRLSRRQVALARSGKVAGAHTLDQTGKAATRIHQDTPPTPHERKPGAQKQTQRTRVRLWNMRMAKTDRAESHASEHDEPRPLLRGLRVSARSNPVN